MAMADRRPLGIPVASTHASPAFNSDGIQTNASDKSMKQTMSDLKDVYSENDITSFTADPSLSPTDMSPNSRSISPDSLMNSGSVGGTKKGLSSNSSRDSTPPSGSHGSQGSQGSQGPHETPGATASAGFYEKAGLSSSILGKKPKPSTRVPIATGISTTIPVTGEKPKPEQDGDASLEDDVLFAIFLILYEKDTAGTGMTVKQICDVLIERHPEMAQLSSKTSNLVSAKLNAYVKRVEKGDSNLKYALSREWADASPKRMVYVYRGLLAKDFHVHVKNAMETQKQSSDAPKFASTNSSANRNSPSTSGGSNTSGTSTSTNTSTSNTNATSANSPPSPAFSTDSFEAAKQSALSKPRRQTMFDLGISRHAFSDNADSSNLFVPYSSAPVAANMASSQNGFEESVEDAKAKESEAEDAPPSAIDTATPATAAKKFINDLDFDFDDLEVFNDTDDDDMGDFSLDIMKRSGKRSKSMSHLTMNKRAKFVTAAAAAPRVPKTPCSHSPHAAAAAAALHAAALKAIAAATTGSSTPEVPSSCCGSANDNMSSPPVSPKFKSNWAHVVRSGFLTQEIGAPEDVSLSDLDKLFG